MGWKLFPTISSIWIYVCLFCVSMHAAFWPLNRACDANPAKCRIQKCSNNIQKICNNCTALPARSTCETNMQWAPFTSAIWTRVLQPEMCNDGLHCLGQFHALASLFFPVTVTASRESAARACALQAAASTVAVSFCISSSNSPHQKGRSPHRLMMQYSTWRRYRHRSAAIGVRSLDSRACKNVCMCAMPISGSQAQ